MEEPEIGISRDEIHMNSAHMSNSLMHLSQDQQQIAASLKPHISSSGLSMEQPLTSEHHHQNPHYISSNTQYTAGSLRRQSRHLEDISQVNETHASDLMQGS